MHSHPQNYLSINCIIIILSYANNDRWTALEPELSVSEYNLSLGNRHSKAIYKYAKNTLCPLFIFLEGFHNFTRNLAGYWKLGIKTSSTDLVFAHLCLEEVFSNMHWKNVSHKFHVVFSQTFHFLFFFIGLKWQLFNQVIIINLQWADSWCLLHVVLSNSSCVIYN